MVILGGLEFVVGGYLVHRHYKNKNERIKNEKTRSEREQIRLRQNSYPGATRPAHPSQQRPTMLQYKYASQSSQASPQPSLYPAHTFPQGPQGQPYLSPPQNVAQFPPQMQPLTRVDSFATISHMPVANGSIPQESLPTLPPRPQSFRRQDAHQRPANHPYYGSTLSASTPTFGQSSNNVTNTQMGQRFGRNMHESDPHTYAPSHTEYSESTQLGDEDDPPPPYRP